MILIYILRMILIYIKIIGAILSSPTNSKIRPWLAYQKEI
jgi:hypothetical protein